MRKDLPLYIILGGLFLVLIYSIVTGWDNRDNLYFITTDESFYTTDNVSIDSNNCLTFVDDKTEREVKVCGNYEIKKPKNYEFEN